MAGRRVHPLLLSATFSIVLKLMANSTSAFWNFLELSGVFSPNIFNPPLVNVRA